MKRAYLAAVLVACFLSSSLAMAARAGSKSGLQKLKTGFTDTAAETATLLKTSGLTPADIASLRTKSRSTLAQCITTAARGRALSSVSSEALLREFMKLQVQDPGRDAATLESLKRDLERLKTMAQARDKEARRRSIAGQQRAGGQETAEELARRMKAAGKSATEIAQKLKALFNKTAEKAAEILQKAGFTAERIARAMKVVFNKSASAAFNMAVAEATDLLAQVFN